MDMIYHDRNGHLLIGTVWRHGSELFCSLFLSPHHVVLLLGLSPWICYKAFLNSSRVVLIQGIFIYVFRWLQFDGIFLGQSVTFPPYHSSSVRSGCMDLIYRALMTQKLLTLHVPNHAAQTSRLLDLLCSKLPILPRLPFPHLSSLQRLKL